MAPKVIAKSDRGVLPVNAATRAAPNAKAPAPRLKLEVRRLPPSLTLTEFEETLGDEWKLGNGKVDWREYRQGKIRAPGKLPEQSRCYIHVANDGLVKEFEQRFLGVVFHDKAGTHRNAELKHLPPSLGFAPNQRTPLAVKRRADNRQGTIDQDSEFIAFLEAETQPIAKPATVDASHEADKPRQKSTPLIDDLRERKANKAKAAASKAEKKKDDDGKAHSKAISKDASPQKNTKTAQQDKVELAAKEAAKALNKQAAGKAAVQQQQGNAKTASPARPKKSAQAPKQQSVTPAQPAPPAASAPSGATSPAPNRGPPGQRQRGNAESIKKMLQKDLGIGPKQANATRSKPAKQAPQAMSSPASSTPSATPPPAAPSKVQPPPAGPKANVQPKPAHSPAPSGASQTKAYLKHANPSQGMTEILILRSLSEHGEVANVTIDPRKGTAIAVFKDNAGLKKALAAKKVPVANGAVEVLEFKEPGVRGGGGGGRGRGGLRGGRGGARGGAQSGQKADGQSTTSTPTATSPAPTPAASKGL
ncbi:hypothetical protein B0A50_00650 [Salinomyces thailandicus]|uniref:UPF3 domain-containing protein n=1 Tax=Salinomyces thailandicus TaxID=706561 RepID=A0A4U0UE93_9PEZI|nr:hypothetical protein B0A50_00650 [Salinomyces thailandica]